MHCPLSLSTYLFWLCRFWETLTDETDRLTNSNQTVFHSFNFLYPAVRKIAFSSLLSIWENKRPADKIWWKLDWNTGRFHATGIFTKSTKALWRKVASLLTRNVSSNIVSCQCQWLTGLNTGYNGGTRWASMKDTDRLTDVWTMTSDLWSQTLTNIQQRDMVRIVISHGGPDIFPCTITLLWMRGSKDVSEPTQKSFHRLTAFYYHLGERSRPADPKKTRVVV